MKYFVSLEHNSKDKRAAELMKILQQQGIEVCDYSACPSDKSLAGICFLLPRCVPCKQTFENLPNGSLVFGYAKQIAPELLEEKNLRYISLSDDEAFIKENNYLTALAQKELLLKRFGSADQKMLVIGYGKLTEQLEEVLTDANIHILNYNHHKTAEIVKKYGEKAFFENAPLADFPVIINTIPKQLITENDLKNVTVSNVIYELASPPYGFDFGKLDLKGFDYNIEPGLPGRYYPDKAARAVFDCIQRFLAAEAKKSIVLCITASPCSYSKLIPILEELCKKYNVIPVMSANATNPNRFLDIEEFKVRLRELSGNNIITTIAGCETLSSRKDVVASAVVPATGNTIAKLANAVTDTPVTMAAKALLRNGKPCIVGISTNDALSGNAANIGLLLNRKNYYFVPFRQDDIVNKPFSMVCDFTKTVETIEAALQGKQLQPIITL